MNKEYTEVLIMKLCVKPRSIEYISQHLDGVDPIAALTFLKELEKENKIRLQDGLWLIEENARKEISELLNPDTHLYLKKYMGQFFEDFKLPHPLDFEWRNSMESVNYLTSLSIESNSINDSILILGMPTLFANLCNQNIVQKVTIVERNASIINKLKELSNKNCKVIEADIFKVDPETVGTYSTVVMDPPWYDEHFRQFIWLAARCLKLGGRLLISIPPINTRPGIDKQRVDWFSFCQEQGLCLENLYSKKLKYLMPFFEWNAIRIAGSLASPFWRLGDLTMFRKLKAEVIERPECIQDVNNWYEVEIKNIRIRIKISEEESYEKLKMEYLTATGILPTVSNRDPVRPYANVWTTGNRIFKVSNTRKFYSLLLLIKQEINEQSEEFKIVNEFITLILELETQEYNNYLEWLYYELENGYN